MTLAATPAAPKLTSKPVLPERRIVLLLRRYPNRMMVAGALLVYAVISYLSLAGAGPSRRSALSSCKASTREVSASFTRSRHGR